MYMYTVLNIADCTFLSNNNDCKDPYKTVQRVHVIIQACIHVYPRFLTIK